MQGAGSEEEEEEEGLSPGPGGITHPAEHRHSDSPMRQEAAGPADNMTAWQKITATYEK